MGGLVAAVALAQTERMREFVDLRIAMGEAFREQRYEDGLTQALEETSALLMAHFAVDAGNVGAPANPNELPDTPWLA